MSDKVIAPARGYLLDNSVLQKLARSENIFLNFLEVSSAFPIFSCPPQVLEYCWSARNPGEHMELKKDMELFTPAKRHPSVKLVLDLQSALWSNGYVRGVGNIDVLIAAYAIENDLIILHSDHDFEHLAASLQDINLRQEFIKE